MTYNLVSTTDAATAAALDVSGLSLRHKSHTVRFVLLFVSFVSEILFFVSYCFWTLLCRKNLGWILERHRFSKISELINFSKIRNA